MAVAMKPVSVDAPFTKALPKVELHAHLTGSISRECLHDIWLQTCAEKPGLDLADPMVVMPVGKVDWDVKTFFALFSSYIYALITTLSSLQHSTLSVLRSFASDGVRYLELRTTPRSIPSNGISKSTYVSTILSCIEGFSVSQRQDQEKEYDDNDGKDLGMSTYLILSIDRCNTLVEAMEVVDIAISYRSRGVVGVDLCGDPSKGDVSVFGPAFAKAKAHGLKLTLHYAEIPASSIEVELRTLLSYAPDRIGHVIHVPEDVKAIIEERELGLELCLSCNVHAKLTTGTYSDHHLGYWMNRACPVILCTDDVGIFNSALSNEYLLAATHFHLSRQGIIELSKAGIDAIFGGEEEKKRLRLLVQDFEDGVHSR